MRYRLLRCLLAHPLLLVHRCLVLKFNIFEEFLERVLMEKEMSMDISSYKHCKQTRSGIRPITRWRTKMRIQLKDIDQPVIAVQHNRAVYLSYHLHPWDQLQKVAKIENSDTQCQLCRFII